MCTALVSIITQTPVKSTYAMTGEITLRGEVLAIGGVKEKLLAAHRGGIKNVIIPAENVKDLKEVPDNIKKDLNIKPVRWIDEVLALALNDNTPTSVRISGKGKKTKSKAKGIVGQAQKKLRKGDRVRAH